MILNQSGRWHYLTRRDYGTQIGFEYLPNGNIIFFPGKIRPLDIPENEEDKKYVCILACAKEIMQEQKKESITAIIYGRKVVFEKKDKNEDAVNKILTVLSQMLAIQTIGGAVERQILEVLRKSIINEEIDIY